MPTVLIVTRNLPPLVGGMERLMWNLIDQLRHRAQVHVIGPKGCREYLPLGVTADEVPLKPLPTMLARMTAKTILRARTLRPDVFLAGSGLTAPMAYGGAKVARARSGVYLHGLDIHPPSIPYRLFWQPFLRRIDRVIVNSRFSRERAEGIGIPGGEIAIVHPGVDLPSWDGREGLRQAFRQRFGVGEAPLLLYVGRITPRKGLHHFLEKVFPLILRKFPETRLVVVGDQPKDALLSREAVPLKAILQRQGLDRAVVFLGQVPDKRLMEAYFAADALVFPIQDRPDDPEGFGMVALEAAAHGLPTVAYASGGVVDAVEDKLSGYLVAPGDVEGFAQAVLASLARPLAPEPMRAFAEGFSWELFGQRLWAALSG